MPDDLGPLRDAIAALPVHAGVVVLAGDGTEFFAEHADEAFPSASVITSARRGRCSAWSGGSRIDPRAERRMGFHRSGRLRHDGGDA